MPKNTQVPLSPRHLEIYSRLVDAIVNQNTEPTEAQLKELRRHNWAPVKGGKTK